MYIIVTENFHDMFDTSMTDIGEFYFKTKELAHNYLLSQGYKFESYNDCWRGGCVESDKYVLFDENLELNLEASIIKLELFE